jgi:hypothetical protein
MVGPTDAMHGVEEIVAASGQEEERLTNAHVPYRQNSSSYSIFTDTAGVIPRQHRAQRRAHKRP